MEDKSSEAMNLRFLIDTNTQRIVYAEAGKEFVDFLFSFLSMPIGSVLNLVYDLELNRKIGSVSNLYDSIEELPSEFMSTDKSQLLDPIFITAYSNNILRDNGPVKIPIDLIKNTLEGQKFYLCSYLSPKVVYSKSYSALVPCQTNNMSTTHNISTSSGDKCICGNPINLVVQLRQNTNSSTSGSSSQSAGQGQSGYVKEVATFIITDDLKIKGSSTSTIMTLLNQFNIKDLSHLEERTGIVDGNKALEILEASLVSTTVLNDVFGAEFSVPSKSKISAKRRKGKRI